MKSLDPLELQKSRDRGLVAQPLKAAKVGKSAVVQSCSLCSTEVHTVLIKLLTLSHRAFE